MNRAWVRVVTLTVTVLIAAGAGQAAAATLTVTTFDDNSGTGDGRCSLREAIAAVDSPGTAGTDCKPAAFGANTIVIPAGTGNLTGHFDPTTQHMGELVVVPTVTNLTIVGAGETKTTIAANQNLGDRLLEISPGATVTIKGLTLTNGQAAGGGFAAGGNPGGDGANGGAILNGGSLGLVDSAVTNSTAGNGGRGGNASPVLPVADGGTGGAGGAGGSGGGIYNTGVLTLQGSTISGNTAGSGGDGGVGGDGTDTGGPGGVGGPGGAGGGVANVGGTLAVIDSTFNGNESGDGGIGGWGGGAPTAGAGSDGGPASGGGGIMSTGGSLSITNGTFASNSAGDGRAGGNGGGGDDAAAGGNGGSGGSGGAIDVLGMGSSSLESVTIAGNNAGGGGDGGLGGNGGALPDGAAGTAGAAGTVGGIVTQGAATTLQNSLLASNNGGNCSASVLDAGHNLSFAGGGCPATFASADPNLGPFQDNGGPAQTISLGPGSAAIDQVPASGAGCPATDERGVVRPNRSGCDIGAYEVAPPTATTGRAKSVTATSATVTASVTPDAGVATVEFEFGTSKKYKAKPAVQHIGGVGPVTVTRKLTGLRPGTTYHYRVIVVAPDGTAKGQDRTFKTKTRPALTKLSVKPVAFRASGPGATLSYSDSDPGTTTFTVLRCATPLSHGACARFVKVAAFTHRDHAGRNKLRLRARIGSRTLSAGIYRLSAAPRAARKTGKTVSAKFQIRG
jgi:CSLREA domain-containing protein